MKNIKKSIKFKLIIHIIILSIVMGIASLFFLSKLRNASIVSKQLEREVLLTSETLLLMQRSLADAYKYQEYFHEKFHDPKDFVKIQRSESEFLYLMVKYNMNIVRLLGNRESADSKKHFDRFTFSIWQEMKIKEFDIPELPDVVKDRKQILQNRSNQYLHSAWQYFRTYKQWLRLQYMGKAYEANVVERKLGQLLVDASLSYNEIQEEIITVHRVLGDFNTQRIHEGYLNFKKVSENLIYLGVLLFFSILFLTLCFVQSNVIKPIRILIEGMQKVKEGKYEVRISSISSDEFDDLALSFNQMLDNLAIVKADRMQLLEEIQRRKVIEGELSAKTKSLDAQNTLFQAVLKSVNEGVIVCDKEGNFIVYNEYAKERLGLDKDAGGVPEDWPKNFGLYHSDTKEFYKAEDLPMVQALNGRYIVDELIYIKNENHKEGVYITINASPLKDKQGDIIGGTSVLRDITKMIEEQKKLETINLELRMNERAMLNILKDLKEAEIQIKKTHVKLVQSEKLASIGHLAAGIAHEINNPIGFIGSNLQTLGPYIKSYRIMLDLSRQLCEAVEQKDWDKAEIINQQWNDALKENNIEFIETDIYSLLDESNLGIDRVKNIVNDLRAFSRQESEEKNTFKVDDVLENVLRIVHNELKYKVNITTDFKDTPEIKGYAQKIGQVFINLLINAAQAIEKNGTISIKTWCDAKYVYISVADTGEGIEEEILSNIFNPFFTTKPVGTGTGLGLSISYEIITEHGGEIKCYSQAGEGATFLVSLPFE